MYLLDANWPTPSKGFINFFPSIILSCTSCLHAGKLHFVKFETSRIDSAMSFIKENCLHMSRTESPEVSNVVRIKATGGGAFKFADVFQVQYCLLQRKRFREVSLQERQLLGKQFSIYLRKSAQKRNSGPTQLSEEHFSGNPGAPLEEAFL